MKPFRLSTKAIELDPNYADAWINKGKALRKLGQPVSSSSLRRDLSQAKVKPQEDAIRQLESLGALKKAQGLITELEFAAQKAKLLEV